MKKIFRKLSKKPMFWVFVLICLLFLPSALIAPSENASIAIINSIALDKNDDQCVVSALALIPVNNTNFTEKYKFISAKGNTMLDALRNLQVEIGKRISLIHADVIIVGRELGNEDLTHHLSSFSKKNYIGNETSVIFTDENAGDLLKRALELDTSSGNKLSEIVIYNEEYVYPVPTSLESFIKGAYMTSKSSFLGVVSKEKEQNTGIETGGESGGDTASTSQSGGMSSGEEGDPKKNSLSNLGRGAIFRDGKFVAYLTPEETMALGWLRSAETQRLITIDGVEHEEKKDVMLSYRVRNNVVKNSVRFRNGVPRIHFDVNLDLTLDEVVDSENKANVQWSFKTFLTNEVRDKISNKIRTEFSKALNVLKKNNCDVVGFAKMCERNNANKFQQFLNSIENPDEYLKHIITTMTVNISVKE